MPHLLLLVLALAPAFACAAPQAGDPPPFDAAARMADWVGLWNTRDLDRVANLFLDDARLSYFSSEREGVIRGLAAVRAHHEGFGFPPGGAPADRQIWVGDVASDTFGSTAVVTALWYFGDPAVPDSAQRGPMTVVYARAGGDYRIAHMHFASYPAAGAAR
jgi:ketosteroid isomerase-like protein